MLVDSTDLAPIMMPFERSMQMARRSVETKTEYFCLRSPEVLPCNVACSWWVY